MNKKLQNTQVISWNCRIQIQLQKYFDLHCEGSPRLLSLVHEITETLPPLRTLGKKFQFQIDDQGFTMHYSWSRKEFFLLLFFFSLLLVRDTLSLSFLKVHIFWEGHKILRNLHRRFDRYYIGQIYSGDFAKLCGLLRIYELFYVPNFFF